MTISLLLSDVDGTLVTDDKRLTERAVAAVHALRAAGVAFAVTSSRPPRGLAMMIGPLGLETPIAGFNGGVVVAPDFTVLETHFLPRAAAEQAIRFLEAQGVQIWAFTPEAWMVRDPHAAYVDHERHTVQFEPTVVDDFGPALDRIGKIVGVSAEFDRLAECETALAAELDGAASVVRSQKYYLDITHPDANKGAVVGMLSRRLGIPRERIAVIGDGHNDVPMFRQASFSVAMGQAAEEVKRAADAVTLSNHDDGFADAVERYILPRA
jgi:Cof subfamily protein (haloacid dehalogenase superfamily)